MGRVCPCPCQYASTRKLARNSDDCFMLYICKDMHCKCRNISLQVKCHIIPCQIFGPLPLISAYSRKHILSQIYRHWNQNDKLSENLSKAVLIVQLTINMISCIFQLNCKANAENLKWNSVFIWSICQESVSGSYLLHCLYKWLPWYQTIWQYLIQILY